MVVQPSRACRAHGTAAGGEGDDDQRSRRAPRGARQGPEAGYGLPQALARVHLLRRRAGVQHAQLPRARGVPAACRIHLIWPQQEHVKQMAWRLFAEGSERTPGNAIHFQVVGHHALQLMLAKLYPGAPTNGANRISTIMCPPYLQR